MGFVVYALAFVSPAAAGLFRVWVNQDAVQIGYELSAQATRRRQLDSAARQLEVELAAERAPGRLVQLSTQLGLAPVEPGRRFGAREARRGP